MEYLFCILIVPVAVVGLTLITHVLKNTKVVKGLNPLLVAILIGVVFGAFGIVSTHTGIVVNGSIINCRDAWILVCGAVFGPVAGITAGVVAGVERLLVGLFANVGSYSSWACSIAALLSGVVGGLLYYVFKKKERLVCPLVAAGSALVVEIIHMGLIVLFKINDASNAWNDVVLQIAGPMVCGTVIAVLLAVFFSNIFQKKYLGVEQKCCCKD